MTTKIYTVSELNREIKLILERSYPYIWIEGEISNFRVAPSGHFYFTLKDKNSQIQAVMFRSQQRSLRFQLEDGAQVICQGRIGVYEQRGVYQLYVDVVEPRGIGALQLAFEQLKKKLAAEGLFDSDKKKPFPTVPQRIAIVTSPRGAAVRDVIKILGKSALPLEIYIFPVKVQGEGASAEIIQAIEDANRLVEKYSFDLLILCRGGGSIEDLWPFNEESLARAIFHSEIPVISAVGHEIDFTIADLVADFRAPTPTGAAEMIVTQLEKTRTFLVDTYRRIGLQIQNILKLKRQYFSTLAQSLSDPRRLLTNWRLSLDDLCNRMIRTYSGIITKNRRQLTELERRMHTYHPGNVIRDAKQRCLRYERELEIFMRQLISRKQKEVEKNMASLDLLNPLAVLERGYSITYLKPEMEIVKSSTQAKTGDKLKVRLSSGSLDCTVEKTRKRS